MFADVMANVFQVYNMAPGQRITVFIPYFGFKMYFLISNLNVNKNMARTLFT